MVCAGLAASPATARSAGHWAQASRPMAIGKRTPLDSVACVTASVGSSEESHHRTHQRRSINWNSQQHSRLPRMMPKEEKGPQYGQTPHKKEAKKLTKLKGQPTEGGDLLALPVRS